jgi:hypothetical protein
MVVVCMNPCHQKLLGEKFVYELEVLLGCQKILDEKVPKDLKEGGVKKSEGFYHYYKHGFFY